MKRPERSVMPRNFTYALEGLRRKHEWQLEAAQTRLAKIGIALAQALEQLTAAQGCLRGALAAAQQKPSSLEPDVHERTLAYLLSLQRQVKEAEQKRAELERQQSSAREDCLAQYRKSESLERDRKRALHEHRADCVRREEKELERDWNGREGWRAPRRDQDRGRRQVR